LQGAEPGTQRPVAITVAVGRAVAAAFMAAGANQPFNIRLHEQLHHGLRDAAQEIAISGLRQQRGQR
jgi:hypothetical protein